MTDWMMIRIHGGEIARPSRGLESNVWPCARTASVAQSPGVVVVAFLVKFAVAAIADSFTFLFDSVDIAKSAEIRQR